MDRLPKRGTLTLAGRTNGSRIARLLVDVSSRDTPLPEKRGSVLVFVRGTSYELGLGAAREEQEVLSSVQSERYERFCIDLSMFLADDRTSQVWHSFS